VGCRPLGWFLRHDVSPPDNLLHQVRGNYLHTRCRIDVCTLAAGLMPSTFVPYYFTTAKVSCVTRVSLHTVYRDQRPLHPIELKSFKLPLVF
jgi:hypothetical protein